MNPLRRNRNARIQQAPIIMSSSSSDSPHLRRSSIPTSVEFTQGGRPKHYIPRPPIILHEQHKEGGQGSRPIPIKKCRPSPQEMEDEVNSADSASHYDWATWQMYTRIATARRLRAAAHYRSTCSSSSISTRAVHQLSQQQSYRLIESGSMMHHDLLSQEQELLEASTTRDGNDSNDDEGVFAFDMS